MADFVHLHNHTDYSLLDGAAPIEDYVAKAQKLGMTALAITDHGNMFGALRFWKECKNAGINPIIGCEFYVAPGSRFVKSGSQGANKYYHLVLLAKNETGYKNLLILTSLGYTEGFYYKPRIDEELLLQYTEGLICLSACLAGLIPELILSGKPADAKQEALKYQDIFGHDHYYLEMQNHGIPEQKIVNEGLINISKETGIPLVATNDIHYIEKSHSNAQDILICIGTNKKKAETNRMRFPSDEFYFKSSDEMASLFSYAPQAIANTTKIAQMCSLEIPLPGPILPHYEIPEEFSNPAKYLEYLTYKGIQERYADPSEEIMQRTQMELDTINGMGFAGYFLIVWDFIDYARRNDIPVGPGRGSGAGSIVAYALKITDVDPLKYQLLFERFLNPERISMPDFDIDFCFERRNEVIEYVTKKYGEENVAAICTFGTLKTKAVLKDVARVLDIPFAESNIITKVLPQGQTPDGRKIDVNVALEIEPRLQEFSKKGNEYEELFEVSAVLEGMSRHVSTHACGMVIGKSRITDYVPLYKEPKTGQISTEYTMDQLEECGLVKMDFLGLKTLTVIKNTENLIKKRIPDFDIEAVDETDAKAFKMLSDGKSIAVFQFESSGMQAILKRAKPDSIEDLIALNALYRPGPMQFIPQFIDSKNGKTAIKYPHQNLKEILAPTYGVIVYQEQVMQVAQIVGGFSLGKADILRRAMGKKKVKDMERMKAEFVQGALKRGYSEQFAKFIFEMLEPFAGYGFNKSHAAAYSILAYKTAYLKAHFPAEFMAANLTNEINNPENYSLYLSEVDELGIKILPPHINLSEKLFSVVDGQIVYGFLGVKNVGSAAVDSIVAERKENGKYENFMDFLERIDIRSLNRKVLETLICAGIFDGLGFNRATMFYNLDKALEHTASKKDSKAFGQVGLFDACEEEVFPEFQFETYDEWDTIDLLKKEKENLGFYVSGHPLDKYKEIWKKCSNLDTKHLERAKKNKTYKLLGLIKSLKSIVTKKGKPMAFAALEDFNGTVELTFFSDTWEKYRDKLETEMVTGLTGKLDVSRDVPQIIVEELVDPDAMLVNDPKELHIKLLRGIEHEHDLQELRGTLLDHTGNCEVYLHFPDKAGMKHTVVRASKQIAVNANNGLVDALKEYPFVEEVWRE